MSWNVTDFARRRFFVIVCSMVLLTTHGSVSYAGIVGYWEFNDSTNLGRATIGTDLTVAGTAPTWSASQTYNGLTLNGVIETAVGIPNHLIATHGVAPNGGGTKANQYTMLFDIRRPDTAEWRTLFQTNTANTGDGDYFVRDSDAQLGVGALGYTTNYAMPANTWARVVITSDLAAGEYRTYVDGVLRQSHTATPLDGRHAFDPTVLLFGDEDNENGLLSVGAVAIWNQPLTANEVSLLGIAGVAVPEPGSLAIVSLIGLGFFVRRYRQRKV
jgi:hypothetical protein